MEIPSEIPAPMCLWIIVGQSNKIPIHITHMEAVSVLPNYAHCCSGLCHFLLLVCLYTGCPEKGPVCAAGAPVVASLVGLTWGWAHAC